MKRKKNRHVAFAANWNKTSIIWSAKFTKTKIRRKKKYKLVKKSNKNDKSTQLLKLKLELNWKLNILK